MCEDKEQATRGDQGVRGIGGAELLVPLAVTAVVVLAVAWIIFGFRGRLDRIISQLEGLRREIRGDQPPEPETDPFEEITPEEERK